MTAMPSSDSRKICRNRASWKMAEPRSPSVGPVPSTEGTSGKPSGMMGAPAWRFGVTAGGAPESRLVTQVEGPYELQRKERTSTRLQRKERPGTCTGTCTCTTDRANGGDFG